MSKPNIKDLISGAVSSATLKETEEPNTSTKEFKNKMIKLPIELDDRIKKIYNGTCSSYILMAIYEKLKRDEN